MEKGAGYKIDQRRRALGLKPLTELIQAYTSTVKQGDMPLAYRGILEFLGHLRSRFMKSGYEVSGLYPGYMDMSYVSVNTSSLKERGLKIAVVYLHGTGCFEVWLSARNRTLSEQYATTFQTVQGFHNDENLDAILERALTSSPDFDEPEQLAELIEREVERFIQDVETILEGGR